MPPRKSFLKRVLWSALLIVGVLVLGMAVWIGPMIYRVKIGLKQYETVPPVLPVSLGDKAILIFSKTNGFRDDNQIETANAALAGLARQHGWSSFVTENAAVFNPEQLRRFKVVVWNSVSGDVLTDEQRHTFKQWLEQGGGFIGLHGSGGDPSYAWKWYVDDLIGTQFIGHTLSPQIQQATLIIEDANHPATRGLGATWIRSDEWYSFAASPRSKGFHILVSIDESSYRPTMALPLLGENKDIRMGKEHPLVWWHCVGKGRALYSALGHAAASYAEPKHVQMIAGAISWAGGLEGAECGGAAE